MNNLPKVVIIGAGPSGILCCRHLKNKAEILCFEGNSGLGGQWLPQKQTNNNSINQNNNDGQKQLKNGFQELYGTHFSSLYKDLTANIPWQCMTFKGFKHPNWEKYKSAFISAEEFLKYQQDYADFHGLQKYMNFNRFVLDVALTRNLKENEKQNLVVDFQKQNEIFSAEKKFVVTVCDTQGLGNKKKYLADFVLVCNGHNIKPFSPKIQNQEKFQGKIYHSHDIMNHTEGDLFENQNIIVQGVRASGKDMVNMLAKLEKKPRKIYWVGGTQSQKEGIEKSSDFKEQLSQKQINIIPKRISSIQLQQKQEELNSSDRKYQEIVLVDPKNGDKEVLDNIDCIINCTGYKYFFPFLKEEDNLIEYEKDIENPSETNYKLFGPLYKRMFSIRENDLIFVGLMERVRGLQMLIEREAIIASLQVQGKLKMPTQQEQIKEWESDLEEIKTRDPKMRNLLQIDPKTFSEKVYAGDLSKLAEQEFDDNFNDMVTGIIKQMAPFQSQFNEQTMKNTQWFKEWDYVGKEELF